MTRKAPSPVLKAFLGRLAGTVAKAADDRTRGEAIAALAPRLASLPDEAFSEACYSAVLDGGDAASLHADVAAQRIQRWWDANRPLRPGEIPRHVQGARIPEDAKRWVAFWVARVQGGASALPLRLALSLIRAQSIDALEWLLVHDDDAGIIGRRAGWMTQAARQEAVRRDWRDPAKVALAQASCQGFHEDGRRSDPARFLDPMTTLRALVARWAPENLGLLDPPPPPAREPGRPVFGDLAPEAGDLAGGLARGRSLDQRTLAAAYAQIPSAAGQFRAAQLARQEDHDA